MTQHHTTAHAKSLFQIEIPRRAPTCSLGGEPFAKGEEYYSMISDSPVEGVFERRDFCLKCAGEFLKTSEAHQGRSLWKSAIPPQKEPSNLPKERDARALALLKEMLGANDPNLNAEAFVLALYLARRRRIYQRQEVTLPSGREGLVFEVAQTEEMLCIPKLPLSELQVAKVQESLAAKMKA